MSSHQKCFNFYCPYKEHQWGIDKKNTLFHNIYFCVSQKKCLGWHESRHWQNCVLGELFLYELLNAEWVKEHRLSALLKKKNTKKLKPDHSEALTGLPAWSGVQLNQNRPAKNSKLRLILVFLQPVKSTRLNFLCSEQWCGCRGAPGSKGRLFLLHCNCQRVPFSVCTPCQLPLMPASWQVNEGPLVPLVSFPGDMPSPFRHYQRDRRRFRESGKRSIMVCQREYRHH